MRKLILISLLLGTVLIGARAQDNPYSIDNECFEYFKIAERTVDDLKTTAFEIANEALLKKAVEKKDEKARCLYYTGVLKRTSRLSKASNDRIAGNEAVDKAREQLKAVSKESGYLQYYYYAYDLSLTYYINTKQEARAQQLMQEMMNVALEEGDEYGLWDSLRFMSSLFQSQNDQLHARKYLRQFIEIARTSTDPAIRRQTITRQCCSMAETYPIGSDSARFYYKLGEECSGTHTDTTLIHYYRAQLAAYDKNRADYITSRDYCLSDDYAGTAVRGMPVFFRCVEDVLNGTPLDRFAPRIDSLEYRQQIIFIRELAILHKRWDVAADAGNRAISTLQNDIYRLNTLRMDEVSAAYGNNELAMKLAKQEKQTRTVYIIVLSLGAAVLFLSLLAALLYIRNMKHKRKTI